ncbi:MAG: glycosyltransferase family 1 protein [Candidatus Promineifilaceae bacterium]|nr:glycosyltransferase family 1 protein [Candidatus Promineifilaceae bacterium]
MGIDASAMLIAKKHGYENYVSSLLSALTGLGEELGDLELVFYFHAGNPLADRQLLSTILPAFTRYRCRVYPYGRLFGLFLPLIARIDRLKLLHLPVYAWRGGFHCPVLVTVHDTCGARLSSTPGKSTTMALGQHHRQTTRLLRLSSAVVTVSHSVRRDLETFYDYPAKEVAVVYHGIDEFFFPDNDAAGQVQSKYDLSQAYILVVNAVQVRKNHRRLLQAYQWLLADTSVDVQLVLVGRRGPGSRAIVRDIECFEPAGAVRYLDYVRREELRGLYTGAKLVVNPSLCEGFGLPLLEAMACGTPLAVSDATSFPEVAGDAAAYFDPYDVGDMAHTIHAALTDERLRTELKEAGKKRVAEFSWRRSATQMAEIYRRLGQRSIDGSEY